MLKLAKTGLFAVLVSSLLTTMAWAEEKKDQQGFVAYSLGEIYITDGKVPVTKQTSIVNEITAEDIAATNSKTMVKLLRAVASATMRSMVSTFAAGSSGSSSRRMLRTGPISDRGRTLARTTRLMFVG